MDFLKSIKGRNPLGRQGVESLKKSERPLPAPTPLNPPLLWRVKALLDKANP